MQMLSADSAGAFHASITTHQVVDRPGRWSQDFIDKPPFARLIRVVVPVAPPTVAVVIAGRCILHPKSITHRHPANPGGQHNMERFPKTERTNPPIFAPQSHQKPKGARGHGENCALAGPQRARRDGDHKRLSPKGAVFMIYRLQHRFPPARRHNSACSDRTAPYRTTVADCRDHHCDPAKWHLRARKSINKHRKKS